jgi:hypothetical protein
MNPGAAYTYEALQSAGWTDQQIVEAGYATMTAPAAEAPPVYTAEGVADILRTKAQAMGDNGVAIANLMQNGYGTMKASEISPEKYPQLVADVEALEVV